MRAAAVQTAAIRLAVVFGLFLAVAETARNWGDWQWWPFWLVDYIAALLLVAGARLASRGARGGAALLSGAWGFTTAMFYSSFFSHIEHFDQAADGNLDQRPLTIVIGVMWALTLLGFALSLLSAREARPAG